MKYTFIFLFLTGLLSGCATPISQPVAARPLVEVVASPQVESVPKPLWSKLNSILDGEFMIIAGRQMLIEQRYYSASGSQCLRLNSLSQSDIDSPSKTVCKENQREDWFFAKSVISFYSNKSDKDG
jgi:hypothetical protein